jgi:ABC-type multidrug transport system ATPase subunit
MEKLFVLPHFKACLYRRAIIVKRSWRSVIISIATVFIFSGLALITFYLMKSLLKATPEQVTFASLMNKNTHIAYEINSSETPEFQALAHQYVNIFMEMFRNDTGKEPTVHAFQSRDDLNAWFYSNSETHEGPDTVSMGLGFKDFYDLRFTDPTKNHTNDFIVYWNSTEQDASLVACTFVSRLQWKWLFGVDKDFSFTRKILMERLMNQIFGYMAPMLISLGMVSIVPLIVTQPIVDMTGEVRQYMISCTMSILCYWAAAFVVDFVVWMIAGTLVWLLFIAGQVASFHDNSFNVWYSFVMAGPSFILMLYCVSFLFGSPGAASRQAFLVVTILLLTPVIIDVIDPYYGAWLEWIFALIPALFVQRLLNCVLINIGAFKHNLSYYFKDPHAQPYLIMEFIDILIYAVILAVIEFVRVRVQRAGARRTFGDYGDFFQQEKAKHPVTDEVHAMEDEVALTQDYAVRILNCSRLFFNTAGNPIPAVNCVSLGVKQGSLFGFLGANGAGKTTLIKMITSMLPPSDGVIEIFGRDIANENDPTVLSTCPQFNTHLCDELTPYEHFVMYALLYQIPPDEAEAQIDRLIEHMEMDEFKDKPLRELSGGNVRKLAIALSFLGPARIILLDEPTASLDAVARRRVHEMILDFKGEKTFMLCTHLLTEAESLCDMISIMVKGCVYTVGSPEYLSAKFGREYRVDILLENDSEQTDHSCTKFFAETIPTAKLSISRPKARIYNVPASDFTLPELFSLMEKGRETGAGFQYYTCSSSSLERVFMEIVRMSECDDLTIHE